MPGKSYKYKEFFPDLIQGYKKEVKYLNQIGTLQKKIRKIPNTGKGLKKINQIYNESAQIQTKILNISKVQQQKIKQINKERQKELTINKRNKEALNLKLQTEKQELVLKKKLIRDQARLNAQKKLGVKANRGLGASISRLVQRLGALALAYVGIQTIRQSIDLFKIQEQAVADNVAVFGDFSKTLQKYAADVQKGTTVGDEQTIALTTQAKNFGIVNENVQEATSGAIGLAEKFKKAGLSQETALKGIALAYEGNFSQLERYIPALRNAGSESEKMAILQEQMADGFDLAKEAAKTQTGQLEQMKNELGDAKEEIGEGLIPALIELSKFLLKVVKGFQVMAKAIKLVFLAQKDQAEQNIELLKEELKGQTDRFKLLTINNKIREKEAKLNELIEASNPYSGVIWSKTRKQYLQWEKDRTRNVKLLKAEIPLLKDLTTGTLNFGVSLDGVIGDLEGNTDVVNDNTKALKDRNDQLERSRELGSREGKDFSQGAKGKGLEESPEAIQGLSNVLESLAEPESGEKTFLDRLFGTPEERAEIKSDYQNIYNSLSAITGAFYDVLDNRKDSSAKKDKRRRQVQKGLDITNAIINTALAVTDVIAKAKGGLITKLAAALAIGALGGTMVSKIASSKYFKGTEYLEFGNHPRGRDTIPFMGPDGSINYASGGERIVDVPINEQLGGFPNAMLPTAVNYYKQAVGYQNNNTNVERLLREQNGILRSNRQIIESGGVLYIAINGNLTGEKHYTNKLNV